MAKKERTVLNKTMSPAAIWAVAVGSIIGWGCFIQGANWTVRAGGPLPLMLGIIVGGLLMGVVGRSYSYMIAKFPVAGGEFAYAYQGYGRTAAFICGWMLSLGYISIVALNATALPVLAGYIFPGIFSQGFLYTIAGYDVYIGEVALSVFFILLFGILNYFGAKSVGNMQLTMVLIMCAAVVIAVSGTVFTGNFHMENLMPAYGEGGKTLITGLISILAIAPFMYVGFDCIPQAAEEYNFPPQKAKRLISSALLVGALIYALMALVTDVVLPWMEMASLTTATGAPVKWQTGAMLDMAMGKAGVAFVAVAVTMGIFTGLNGFFMTSSRLIFCMARAKMLPASFARIHPKYRTPSACIIFTTILCVFCPFFGREVLNWVVDMCSVGTAVGYFFTCAGAYILVRKYDHPNDVNRISKGMAGLGCLISLSILLLLVVPGSPACMEVQSFIALGIWVSMGAIFYAVYRRSFKNVSKREMDYLILGNVQIRMGLRKNRQQEERVKGRLVECSGAK
ncbi:MAG: APC family permease [Megasphaera sp.]|jgi:amino acid transporter|nr:APC family permease [Megasphaera sp.]MCH4187689.1 APC family permease [Megasphaera sp.]MCH4217588.1 APC family permease [Megasphaera sp.]